MPPAFWAEVAAVEAELGGSGRVLVRPSGTEPLVRIMVEAATEETAEAYTDRLGAALGRRPGVNPFDRRGSPRRLPVHG